MLDVPPQDIAQHAASAFKMAQRLDDEEANNKEASEVFSIPHRHHHHHRHHHTITTSTTIITIITIITITTITTIIIITIITNHHRH